MAESVDVATRAGFEAEAVVESALLGSVSNGLVDHSTILVVVVPQTSG